MKVETKKGIIKKRGKPKMQMGNQKCRTVETEVKNAEGK